MLDDDVNNGQNFLLLAGVFPHWVSPPYPERQDFLRVELNLIKFVKTRRIISRREELVRFNTSGSRYYQVKFSDIW